MRGGGKQGKCPPKEGAVAPFPSIRPTEDTADVSGIASTAGITGTAGTAAQQRALDPVIIYSSGTAVITAAGTGAGHSRGHSRTAAGIN